MQDRVPLYPGRVILNAVSGQPNTYDMTLADQPSVVGTPLNKANLLSDTTANKIKEIARENSSPNTVNDALEMLTKTGTVVLNGVYTSIKTPLTHNVITQLTASGSGMGSASVGKYALFAGGQSRSGAVDAYSAYLGRVIVAPLSSNSYNLAGASVGNHALFAGGQSGSTTYVSVVNAYNTLLEKLTPSVLSAARSNLAGASIGQYALFAGGQISSTVVDAYDSSLERTTPTALSVGRYELAGASVGGYALFAGGRSSGTGYSTVVDAYDSSLTRTTPTALSVARYDLSGASVGSYALFAGGRTSNGTTDTNASAAVDAYNSSLARSTPTSLSVARYGLDGASSSNYAIFAGGIAGGSDAYSSVVDAYSALLNRTIPTALSVSRSNLSGASVGNHALFAGGAIGSSSYSDVVDAYYNGGGYNLDITIPAWSKYYIEGVTDSEIVAVHDVEISENSSVPFTGYIKRGITLSGLIS